MERIKVQCLASLAVSGSNSQISIPGTSVAMGRNGPRTSAGASGFKSNVSKWLGPPSSQSRIQALARLLEVSARALDWHQSVNPSPSAVSAPMRSASRRWIPSQRDT